MVVEFDDVNLGEEQAKNPDGSARVDEEGRPGIMSSPVTELFSAGDFSLSPRLLPHLVLFNANLWFGNSPNGSSSGLHHDFHDNLYILLRGKKRFQKCSLWKCQNLRPYLFIISLPIKCSLPTDIAGWPLVGLLYECL